MDTITRHSQRTSQAAVLDLLGRYPAVTDKTLTQMLGARWSPSRIRTARRELVDTGQVVAAGYTATPRPVRLWRLATVEERAAYRAQPVFEGRVTVGASGWVKDLETVGVRVLTVRGGWRVCCGGWAVAVGSGDVVEVDVFGFTVSRRYPVEGPVPE